MNKKRVVTPIIMGLFLFLPLWGFSQLRLPKLISNDMLLQRNIDLSIWGWSEANAEVIVQFNESEVKTTAHQNGDWKINLPAQKAGGPYSMTIISGDTIILNNILIGDVWLCSGQSNMELPMRRVSPIYKDEIAEADNPNIRYFEVPKKYDFNTPHKDFDYGNWVDINGESIHNISAVAYFFAQKLNSEYNVPIGIINSSLGGSPVQAWMSKSALKSFPKYYNEMQWFKSQSRIDSIKKSDQERINAWYHQSTLEDKGQARNWRNRQLNTSNWSTINVPGKWSNEDLKSTNGVVWFRKEIEVPAEMCNNEGLLILGAIVDADSVFINGHFVGTTGYRYPPRRYQFPANILQEGKNTIAIRVISNAGQGEFVTDKQYALLVGDNELDLKGEWKYKVGVKMNTLRGQTFIRWKSGGLYNAMINPLFNHAIKGVVWYQGESNTGHPSDYNQLFSSLITDWRIKWEQGSFPFLFVQLANFMEAKPEPTESSWALLREKQLQTLSLPKTAMTVTIDIGEWNDIHPLNKKDVGERLALSAQNIAYGTENAVCSGPIYKSMEVRKDSIILSFSNVGGGLVTKGDSLCEFAIAGADKKFVWANAKIHNNTIIVWSSKIKKPVAVRYGWANNPQKANLYNMEGLPASPFRTDDW